MTGAPHGFATLHRVVIGRVPRTNSPATEVAIHPRTTTTLRSLRCKLAAIRRGCVQASLDREVVRGVLWTRLHMHTPTTGC